MLAQDNERYYKICDDCNKKEEIKEQAYKKNLLKRNHFCNSCKQRGERNNAYNRTPWNKGLNKNTDSRVKKYGDSISITQKSKKVVAWNKNKTYVELKGKEWAKTFGKKVSYAKKGKPNYKIRNISSKYNQSFRYFRKMCKTKLYIAWTRKVLERDNFKCQMCGEGGALEVHHIRKFKDILKLVSNKMSIDLNNYNLLDVDTFNKFRDEIVKEHNMDDGITLCSKCHSNVDWERRRFNNEKNI